MSKGSSITLVWKIILYAWLDNIAYMYEEMKEYF